MRRINMFRKTREKRLEKIPMSRHENINYFLENIVLPFDAVYKMLFQHFLYFLLVYGIGIRTPTRTR